MVPDMIRLAVVWGDSPSETIGAVSDRFGYGLPSSSVSIGRGSPFLLWTEDSGVSLESHRSTHGGRKDSDGHKIVIPELRLRTYPGGSVPKLMQGDGGGAFDKAHGTCVVIEEGGPTYMEKPGSALKGPVGAFWTCLYTEFLRSLDIFVQGASERVLAVDPLFLQGGREIYDLQMRFALEALPPLVI
jgi:hypothetical protein